LSGILPGRRAGLTPRRREIVPIRLSVVVLASVGLAASALAGTPVFFAPGNLAVSQVTPTVFGSGAAFNSQAAAVSIREFQLATPVSGAFAPASIALNAGTTGTRLTIGAATNEGFLTLSNNASTLTIGGYNWQAGIASPNGTSIGASFNMPPLSNPVNRVVGAIDAAGSVAYFPMTSTYSQGNLRSVTSLNGSTFVIGGAAGTANGQSATGGVRALDPTGGNTATTVVVSPPTTGIAVVNHDLSGKVFFSASSTAGAQYRGVNFISPDGTALRLYGMSALAGSLSSQDFWFRDEYTLYVADDGNLTTALGGLQKWTKDPMTGDWSLAYRLTAGLGAGLRGLAGTVDSTGNVILYATTAEGQTQTGPGNFLVAIVDSGPSSTFTTLAQAASGSAFRGVDFTPGSTLIPAPGAAALLGLGGLLAARRRRH
jgi:MYXO-CTERM domain-containing protein